ncbi:MAG: hypothetical protein NZ533_11590 [Casimicrobiaceae bacterium]|nr:hypothetical protein [Casimicrobiaceae bacterium]
MGPEDALRLKALAPGHNRLKKRMAAKAQPDIAALRIGFWAKRSPSNANARDRRMFEATAATECLARRLAGLSCDAMRGPPEAAPATQAPWPRLMALAPLHRRSADCRLRETLNLEYLSRAAEELLPRRSGADSKASPCKPIRTWAVKARASSAAPSPKAASCVFFVSPAPESL